MYFVRYYYIVLIFVFYTYFIKKFYFDSFYPKYDFVLFILIENIISFYHNFFSAEYNKLGTSKEILIYDITFKIIFAMAISLHTIFHQN